jgi:transposase
VIGVDTHRDQHTLAVVSAPAGAVVAETLVRATGRGYVDALRFAERHASGVRVWAIEGAGHYGAGLARYLGSAARQ